MDEIDFILLKKLMVNCRVTYRELATMTNMSVSAIHKRIKNLVDNETISAFIARPSTIALKCLIVAIFGTSNAKSMDAVSKELGQHENVYYVLIESGKHLLILGYLRDISSMRDYSTYVSETAQISAPIIGITDIPYITTPEPLSTIDYKILKTLNRDARKPITDIADDVGISAKTIRKRLVRMIENKLVNFTVEWTEKAENNLTTGYSNIPNFTTMYIWTRNIQESQKIQEELQTEGFKDIIPFIALSGNSYDCWVDQILRTK
ncbi:MAG: AsnC family transcriptional regulator [Promethearchaeota archaeon]